MKRYSFSIKTILIPAVICLSAPLSAALAATAATNEPELAVLPYAVDTIERDFSADDGSDYAKLVALGASVEKGIRVYSARETMKDLSRLGLDPQGRITKEDLSSFCKSRYLPYAAVGRISKTSKGYAAESVLYSADRNAVVGKASVKGRTLAECATRETEELFSRFDDAVHGEQTSARDIALVLDTSYAVSGDWKEISEGLTSLVSTLVDDYPGSTVHLVPFSDSFALKSPFPSIETVPAMKEALSTVKLKGLPNGRAFASALSFALENTQWQIDAERSLLVIAQSPVEGQSLDRYASRAKKLRVRAHVVVLGNLSPRDTELYRRLAQITGGTFFAVSYRQTLFDNKGNEYYLYLNKGRLFTGDTKDPSWKDGVVRSAEKGSRYAVLPSYADEIAVKDDAHITPVTMAEYYRKAGMRSVLNSGELESNVSECVERLTAHSSPRSDNAARPAGRVLLSHGGVSIWVSVIDKKDLEFFRDKKELGFVFPLGVRIMLKKDEPFGMTFNPKQFITGIDWDDLPSAVRVDLERLVKDPAKYARNGFLSPPLYFVNVKVDEVDDRVKKNDIRDDR
jgi:hypothetical protein